MQDRKFISIILSAASIAVYSYLTKNHIISDSNSFIIYSCLGIYFLLSVYTYFTGTEEVLQEKETNSNTDELMNAINNSSEQIDENAAADLHEIEIAKREQGEDEGDKFSIDSIAEIKDDKPEPNGNLKQKLSFKSTSIADVDFEKMEEKALEELASFEKSLSE
jgi:hypothetical protein